jgi:hypothetical protein
VFSLAAAAGTVEVRRVAGGYIGVRDSKNKSMPALGFKAADWRTFVEEVKRSRLDQALGRSLS